MKKKIFVIGGIGFFLLVLLVVAASGNKEIKDSFNKGVQEGKQTVEKTSNQNTQATATTPEQEIENKVRSSLKAKTNNSKDKFVEIRVNKSFGDKEGYVAIVTINADDNLSDDLTMKGIWKDMALVYTSLYKGSQDIVEATVIVHMDVVDKYGNKSDQVVMKTSLDSTEANKVNWNQDEAILYLQVLPKVWTTQTNRFTQ